MDDSWKLPSSRGTDIEQYWQGLADCLDRIRHCELHEIAEALLACYRRGNTVFAVGNGGSAATASHFACDLAKGTRSPGAPAFRCIPLTDSIPVMTAWANDASYSRVFAEQLSALIKRGDVVVAISASGNSPNVLAAVEVATGAEASSIALTGPTGGRLGRMADLTIRVQSQSIEQVEDVHLAICHSVCVYLRGVLRDEAGRLRAHDAGPRRGLNGSVEETETPLVGIQRLT